MMRVVSSAWACWGACCHLNKCLWGNKYENQPGVRSMKYKCNSFVTLSVTWARFCVRFFPLSGLEHIPGEISPPSYSVRLGFAEVATNSNSYRPKERCTGWTDSPPKNSGVTLQLLRGAGGAPGACRYPWRKGWGRCTPSWHRAGWCTPRPPPSRLGATPPPSDRRPPGKAREKKTAATSQGWDAIKSKSNKIHEVGFPLKAIARLCSRGGFQRSRPRQQPTPRRRRQRRRQQNHLAERLEANGADLLPRSALHLRRHGHQARGHERLGGLGELGELGVRRAPVVVCCSVPLLAHGGEASRNQGKKKQKKTAATKQNGRRNAGDDRLGSTNKCRAKQQGQARDFARWPCPSASAPLRGGAIQTPKRKAPLDTSTQHTRPGLPWGHLSDLEHDKPPPRLERPREKTTAPRTKEHPSFICFPERIQYCWGFILWRCIPGGDALVLYGTVCAEAHSVMEISLARRTMIGVESGA